VYGGGTFPQDHGGYPRATTSVAPSLAFAGLPLCPSLPQEDHQSSSESDITMPFSSPGQGLPPPLLYQPWPWMTISIGAAKNMGWSMGLPPRDVPSFSFEFGSQMDSTRSSSFFEFGSWASLGIPLDYLFHLSLDPNWIQLDSFLPLSLDPGPPLGFHLLIFFF
jgi:hypothetical protein